ncbi:MAG: hypothetical protein KatS3mg003_0675 [Candidatus Nitrosocaldaceae archaeon]|nr:MAG: hypothetical protein KatS3mg003_0675 [Candidatus Nitrosocaldaceae archaeon]
MVKRYMICTLLIAQHIKDRFAIKWMDAEIKEYSENVLEEILECDKYV